jgi:hypothetical protein
LAKSQLYVNAVDALGARQGAWARAEARIGAVMGPDPDNGSGADVVEIIQSENHLSVDPMKADPAPMCDLLADLADARWPDEPVEVPAT